MWPQSKKWSESAVVSKPGKLWWFLEWRGNPGKTLKRSPKFSTNSCWSTVLSIPTPLSYPKWRDDHDDDDRVTSLAPAHEITLLSGNGRHVAVEELNKRFKGVYTSAHNYYTWKISRYDGLKFSSLDRENVRPAIPPAYACYKKRPRKRN